MIDENLSTGFANALRAFIEADRPTLDGEYIKVLHLKKDLKFGAVQDDVWIAKLRPPSHHLVITSDMETRKGHSSLQTAAIKNNIPVLSLARKLGEADMIERLRAVLVMWPDINTHILPCTEGIRWKILKRSTRGFQLSTNELKSDQKLLPYRDRTSSPVPDKKKARG